MGFLFQSPRRLRLSFLGLAGAALAASHIAGLAAGAAAAEPGGLGGLALDAAGLVGENLAAWTDFQQRFPTLDPADSEQFHQAALAVRAQHPFVLDDAARAAYSAWLRGAEAMAREITLARAARLNTAVSGTDENGGDFRLAGFREGDRPVYETTQNVNAAVSTAASFVRRSAAFDPALDGSGFHASVNDTHPVDASHPEFRDGSGASRVTIVRGSTAGNHATHVAGTMAARGDDPAALGMAPGLRVFTMTNTQTGDVYSHGMSWPGEPERSVVGNSSLGTFDSSINGVYTSTSAGYDQAHFDTPYYLHFYAAGNSGPDWFSLSTTRKDAKNVLAIGSVSDVTRQSSGQRTGGGTIASSSARGPTRDGRIKPDLVANGIGVYSPHANGAYASTSGTSMASPNAAGSAVLLLDLFQKRFPASLPRAATLMALLIHCAEDLGTPGPDYTHGWGLVNVLEAARIVQAHADFPARQTLIEDRLDAGQTHLREYVASGGEALRATLVWTDPPGTPKTVNTDTSPALTNNLHLRILGPNGESLPFVMPYTTGNGSLPAFHPDLLPAAAATGVNHRDNKLQVLIAQPSPGNYQVEVSHTGALAGGSQRYSLVVTGMSAATPLAQAVIDSHPAAHPGQTGAALPFEITGSGFVLGSTVEFRRSGQSPVRAVAVEPNRDRLLARIDNRAMAAGEWQVVVRQPDGGETVSPQPYTTGAERLLSWSGGSAGGNSSMLTASNWLENESPADPPPADLRIAGRNGASGSIATLFVGGDYAVRSFQFDNSAGRYHPDNGLRLGPTTSSTSTITRTLRMISPHLLFHASNAAKVEWWTFASGASMLLDLDYEGRSEVFVDSTSEIRVSSATLTGRGGLRKTGPGTLRLESANSFGGGLTVEQGRVVVTQAGALGANPASPRDDSVVLNGGALRFESSSSGPAANRGFQVGAAGGTLDISGTAVTLFGRIGDLPGQAGNLIKQGGFILRLNQQNTHSGGTQVREGRVRFAHGGAFGTGPLSLDAGTGILATAAGLATTHPIVLTGGTVRFGGDGHAHIHQGALEIDAESATLQLLDPVRLEGPVSGGRLEVLSDNASRSLTLEGPLNLPAGIRLASGNLEINQGPSGPLESLAGSTLRIGPNARIEGQVSCAGTLELSGGIGSSTTLSLQGATVLVPSGQLSLPAGTTIRGTGTIHANLHVPAGASVSGLPEEPLVVLGEITGNGTVTHVTSTISPATVVDGVQTSPIGTLELTTDLVFPGGVPLTGTPAFRFDLATPEASDRVAFRGSALFRFGTEGLDLRHFEFITRPGFGPGVYPLVTSESFLSGALGPETRATLAGQPVWLRIGNDARSLELRVGPAAEAFPFIAGETYFGRNGYTEYRAGDVPVLLVSGHDGDIIPDEIPARTYGTTARDTNLHPLTVAMAEEFTARTGRRAHLVLSHLRRSRLDPNREIVEAAQGNIHAEQAWHEYHRQFIRSAREEMEKQYGFVLTFDMHGHGHDIARLELGYLLGAPELNVSDATLNLPGYAWQSSLRSLTLRNPERPFASLVRGPTSLGERFNEIGVPAWPSATFPQIGDAPFFSGGFTTREHSCIDCNSPVDAIQIETHFGVRNNATSRAQFARQFNDVLQAFLVEQYRWSPGTGPLFRLEADRSETARGGAPVVLTIHRTGNRSAAETMRLAFSGTATRDVDFTTPATSVSFAAGEAEKTITLTPRPAGPSVGDRELRVRLDPEYRQSVQDDAISLTLGDGVSQTLRVRADAESLPLDAPTARFFLRRTQSGGSLEVPLLWSGTAIPQGHFDAPSRVSFAAGQEEIEITARLRDPQSTGENELTLRLAADPAGDYRVGIPGQASTRLTRSEIPAGLLVQLGPRLEANRWFDLSGRSHHASTLPGGAGPQAAADGSMVFDGLSATAALPRMVADPEGAFSVSFHFRPEPGSLGSERNLLSYGERSSEGSLGVWLSSSSQLRTALGTAPVLTVTGNWNQGVWRHYLLSVNAQGTARIFLDGNQVATTSQVPGPLRRDRLFWLGWNPGIRNTAGFFHGGLRDVRIYQRALDGDAAKALAAGQTNYGTWLADAGIDPASAGEDFLAHYAFAARPDGPAPRAPHFQTTDGSFELSFTRRIDAADLRYELQRATGLDAGDWQTVASLPPGASAWQIAAANLSIEEIHGRTRVRDASMEQPDAPSRLFYRIQSQRIQP